VKAGSAYQVVGVTGTLGGGLNLAETPPENVSGVCKRGDKLYWVCASIRAPGEPSAAVWADTGREGEVDVRSLASMEYTFTSPIMLVKAQQVSWIMNGVNFVPALKGALKGNTHDIIKTAMAFGNDKVLSTIPAGAVSSDYSITPEGIITLLAWLGANHHAMPQAARAEVEETAVLV